MGEDRERKAEQLKQWIKSPNGPKRLVATCRTRDYGHDLDLQLDTVTLQEMDEARVRQFAVNYLQDAAPGFLEKVLDGDRCQRDPRSLRSIARNPFLFTCLMVLYERSPMKTLPTNPGLLFYELTHALWNRELNRQPQDWLPYDQAQTGLASLAFAMIEEDRPTSIPRSYLLDQLQFVGFGQALINVALGATILKSDADEIRFSHQLMQEYFAAVKLNQVGLGNRVGELHFKWADEFAPFAFGGSVAGKWDEVVIAACGITKDTDQFISTIAEHNIFLAVRCALTVARVNSPIATQIARELLSLHDSYLARAESIQRTEPTPDYSHSIVFDQSHDAWEAAFENADGIRLEAARVLRQVAVAFREIFENLAAGGNNVEEEQLAERVLHFP